MANSVNLGEIYGLGSCPSGGCGTNGIATTNTPSLEQIAAYQMAANSTASQGSSDNSAALMNQGNSASAQNMQNPPSMASNQMGASQGMVNSPSRIGLINGNSAWGSEVQNQADSNMANTANMVNNAENGVSNAMNVPMTQSQINAENPEMLTPITEYSQPFMVTADSIQYLNSFMRTQLGRHVRVEFLVGGQSMVERRGVLLAVGANFILLNESGTDDILACDFYNIKFVTFYY